MRAAVLVLEVLDSTILILYDPAIGSPNAILGQIEVGQWGADQIKTNRNAGKRG